MVLPMTGASVLRKVANLQSARDQAKLQGGPDIVHQLFRLPGLDSNMNFHGDEVIIGTVRVVTECDAGGGAPDQQSPAGADLKISHAHTVLYFLPIDFLGHLVPNEMREPPDGHGKPAVV